MLDLVDLILLRRAIPADDHNLTFRRIDGSPASKVVYFLPWHTPIALARQAGLVPLEFLACYEMPEAIVSSEPELCLQALQALVTDAEQLLRLHGVEGTDAVIVGLSIGSYPGGGLAVLGLRGARLDMQRSVLDVLGGDPGALQAHYNLGHQSVVAGNGVLSGIAVCRHPGRNVAHVRLRADAGYRVINQVRITVPVDRLGNILDHAIALGANQINSISFEFAKAETLKDEARKQAMANAKRRAELYASAAGAQLGQVMSISESAVETRAKVFASRAGHAEAATPIETGTRTLTVEVQVTYALR